MNPPLLKIDHLEVRYGDLIGVADVSLEVPRGSVVALLGSNGAGKTTTLNAIARIARVSSGTIAFDGQNIAGQPAYAIVRKGLALSPEGWRLFAQQSVENNLLLGATPLADRKHIDIGVTSDVDATVLASEKDLKSLVRNLVENAVRYTPEQGRVDLSTRVDAMHVYLEIEDSGPGIPHSERARVFDPFYRIPGSADEGSGLGLSIVKTIADRYQATVTLGARADAGQGLRVTVAFPRTA